MNENGWIKLYNKLSYWRWHTDPDMVSLWVHLLVGCNYEDVEWRGTVIGRGQMVVSYSKLSSMTGISVKKIRICIERLESSGEIVFNGSKNFSVLTICNYDEYQGAKKRAKKGQREGQREGQTLDIFKSQEIQAIEQDNAEKRAKETAKEYSEEGQREGQQYKNINKELIDVFTNVNTLPLTRTREERFSDFQKWIIANTPNVSRIREPFTFEQFENILSFSPEFVKKILIAMHNYAPLVSKNVSAYLTFLNWASREEKYQEKLKNTHNGNNTRSNQSDLPVRHIANTGYAEPLPHVDL